jgi:hypothetical protein
MNTLRQASWWCLLALLSLGGRGLLPSLDGSTSVPVVVPLEFQVDTYYEPVVGSPFAMQLSAVGGLPPYKWSLSAGALPAGINLAPSGLLSGTPTPGGAVQCVAVANGSVTMTITAANASDPYFGTLGLVTPMEGSVMVMPANPPTSPSNQAQPGQGIEILFPNGASLGTSNETPGDFTVLDSITPFEIISNGAAPTWTAVSTSAATEFAPASNPHATVTETSWNLDHN